MGELQQMNPNLNSLNSIATANSIEKTYATSASMGFMVLKKPQVSPSTIQSKALRVCRVCGKTAINPIELYDFVTDAQSKYKHENYCHECFNKEQNQRRITFLNKRVGLETNPRINICSNCGKNISENSNRQMGEHHLWYNENNPLDGAWELCMSCHRKQVEIHEMLREGS